MSETVFWEGSGSYLFKWPISISPASTSEWNSSFNLLVIFLYEGSSIPATSGKSFFFSLPFSLPIVVATIFVTILISFMDVGKHEIEKLLNHEPEARDLQNFRNVLKSYPKKKAKQYLENCCVRLHRAMQIKWISFDNNDEAVFRFKSWVVRPMLRKCSWELWQMLIA